MASYTIDKIEYDSNTYNLQDNTSGYTTNTGTVTSVGISNATNGGLSISGSPVTSSGSITVGHSNILTNAQSTQAVYPITIDKNGHISGYGSAFTNYVPSTVNQIDPDPSGTITNSGNIVLQSSGSIGAGRLTISPGSISCNVPPKCTGADYLTIPNYVTAGVLTSSGGRVQFSVPLGRLYTYSASIVSLTCNFIMRASNANGTGLYICRGANDTITPASFTYGSNFTFNNATGTGTSTIPAANAQVSVSGGCHLYFDFSGTTDAFSGNSTNRGRVNNNAVVVAVYDLQLSVSN